MFWKKKTAEDYVAKKEYKKAVSLYRERLADQPENTALIINIADTLMADKEAEEALKEYKKVADIYTDQGFIVKAIAIYKKMLKIRPDMQEIEHLLANLSERVANHESPTSIQPQNTAPSKPEVTKTLEIENKLLKDLTTEEFKQIVKKLNLRYFDEDTIVVKEGDPGDSLFIIVRGQVRVLTKDANQREVLLANLGEGEFFGEIALITGKPRTATIITNTTSELLELTRKDYDAVVAKHPHVKQVVEDFHLKRAYKTIEALIQSLQEKQS